MSTLCEGAQQGNLQQCRSLLDRGANVNECHKFNSDEVTPLYVAAQEGRLEVCQFLVSRGADVNKGKDNKRRIDDSALFSETPEPWPRNDRETPLYIAAQNGYLEVCRLFLDRGADVNEGKDNNEEFRIPRLRHIDEPEPEDDPDDDTVMPLFAAAQKGHFEVCQLLVGRRAKIDKCDRYGRSPLFIAAQNGHLEVCQLLLDRRAKVDKSDKTGRSPLLVASKNGHLEVCQLLLNRGANVNRCDRDARSPLFAASENGHLMMCELLLDYGADVNMYEKNGCSPLHIAAQNSHSEVCNLLLARGANIANLYVAASVGHLQKCRSLLDRGTNVNKCYYNGTSALYIAAKNGHFDVCQLLLDRGADVNKCDNNDLSPLFIAAQNGHLEVCQLLLDRRAKVDKCDREARSPLFTAAQNGHLEVCQLLAGDCSLINKCDRNARSPLLAASENGHLEVCQLLVDLGADLKKCDRDARSPLLAASENGHLMVCALLLGRGADVNKCDREGRSPLLVAARNGHAEVCQLLLDHGADEEGRWSPLVAASENGHLEVCVLLLNRGADVNRWDEQEVSPLVAAARKGHLEVCALLLDRGADTDYWRGIPEHFLELLQQKLEQDKEAAASARQASFSHEDFLALVRKESSDALSRLDVLSLIDTTTPIGRMQCCLWHVLLSLQSVDEVVVSSGKTALKDLEEELPFLRRTLEASSELSTVGSLDALFAFAASPQFASSPRNDLARQVLREKVFQCSAPICSTPKDTLSTILECSAKLGVDLMQVKEDISWTGLKRSSELTMDVLAAKKELEMLAEETEESCLETALETDPFKDLPTSVSHPCITWCFYSQVREQVTERLATVRKLREEAEALLSDDDTSLEKLISLVEHIKEEGLESSSFFNAVQEKIEVLKKKIETLVPEHNTSRDGMNLPGSVESDKLCIICQERASDITYIPCGHRCACFSNCFSRYLNREEIETINEHRTLSESVRRRALKCPLCRSESLMVTYSR